MQNFIKLSRKRFEQKKLVLRQLPNNNEVKQSAERAKPHATLSDHQDKEV